MATKIKSFDQILWALLFLREITLESGETNFELIGIHPDELGVMYIIDEEMEKKNKGKLPIVKNNLMIISILPDELLPEFRESWKLGYIKHLSIDYADNAIYAIFEEKLVTIFKFDNFGWINDNRYNTYLISAGPAGIMIQILSRE